MSGTISGLRVQQHNAERVNVYLDGEFAFGLTAIYAAGLRVGQQLSDREIAQLQETDLLEQTYERAIRFLSYRPRSEAEVRRYLKEKAVEAAAIDAVVDRLRGQHYLDDAEFARYWVENRQRFRPRGARALRHELRLKGVEAETVEEAVGEVDGSSLAIQAARPQAERQAALAEADPQAFKRKLMAFLMRRGFDYGDAREAVNRLARELGAEASSELEEEI